MKHSTVLLLTLLTTAARAESVLLWTAFMSPAPIDATSLPNGNIVFGDGWAIQEVTPTGTSGYSVVSTIGSTLRGARPLPNGDYLTTYTLIGDEKVGRLNGSGGVVSEFGTGTNLCNDSGFKGPEDFIQLANGDYLVADTGQNRLIQLNAAGAKVWSFGTVCTPGSPDNGMLRKPTSLFEMPNGNLIVSEGHDVVEIARAPTSGGSVTRWYGTGAAGSGPNELSAPQDAVALASGNWLITDSDNARIIEVNPDTRSIAWQFGVTGTPGGSDDMLDIPLTARPTPRGGILIADWGNGRLLEVSPLVLNVASAPALTTGVCSAPLVINVQDVTGAAQPVPTNRSVILGFGPNLSVFSDSGCTTPVTTASLVTGATSATLFVRANTAGTEQLDMAVTGYRTSATVLTVIDPSSSAPPQTPSSSGGDVEVSGSRLLTVGCNCSSGVDGTSASAGALLLLGFLARRRRVEVGRMGAEGYRDVRAQRTSPNVFDEQGPR
ncbi:MAG: MYXO-CTERM sorting domain-containing protein [Myxococcaceae bacterium]